MIADSGRSLGLGGLMVVSLVVWLVGAMWGAWCQHRDDRYQAMRDRARAAHPTAKHVHRRRPPFDHHGEP